MPGLAATIAVMAFAPAARRGATPCPTAAAFVGCRAATANMLDADTAQRIHHLGGMLTFETLPELYRTLFASPAVEIDRAVTYYDASGNQGVWTSPINGVHLTPAGYFGAAVVLANTLWAPWGLVNVRRRGGLDNPWWLELEEQVGDAAAREDAKPGDESAGR